MVRAGSPAGPRRGILEPGYQRKDRNWVITTTSTAADQSIGSVVVTNGKIFKVQAIILEVYYTTLDTTPAYLGTLKVDFGGSVFLGPLMASNTSSGAIFGLVAPIPDEGLEFLGDGSKTLAAWCTPASATSTVWRVTIIGYERG